MSKKILIISPIPTHPPFSGNSNCILSYSQMLIEAGYNIYFLWIADVNSTQEEEMLTRNFWKDKIIIFKETQFHRIMKAFFRYIRFNRKGYYNVDDFHPYGIKRVLLKVLKHDHFDCVIVNYIFLSKIFNYITDSKKILYTHDVFTNRFQQTGNPWFSVTANEEAKGLNRAETILAIQENEAIFYRHLTTRKILAVYSYFPVHDTPFTGKKTLLFMAGKNIHNQEAITTFIEKVFRPLKQVHPEIKLLIGGSICKIINRTFREDSIEFFDEVNDLYDFYSLGDIFINPTLNGTGLKIKTFEAMSFGKVVISHPHNTLGIYKKEQAPILLAETSKDYIDHLDSLLDNREKLIAYKQESIKYIMDLNSIVKTRFVEAIEK